MDKKIIIKGKKTFDKIQGVKAKRSCSKNWIGNESLLNKKEQISNLNKLLLGINYKGDKYVKKELERKKLQRIKDVIYDAEKCVIKDIIGLTYNKSNLKFTIKNKDRTSGTLKNLAPKTRKKIKKRKNKDKKSKDKNKDTKDSNVEPKDKSNLK